MIHPAKLTRLLDDGHVLRFFDDADQPLVTRGAGTKGAGIGIGDVIARRAIGDSILHIADGVTQPLRVLARRAQDVKREPCGTLGADARQFLKLLDEPD